jgi:hypothetical protein
MNMIFDSSNLECNHLVMSGDAAYVSPNAIFDFGDNPRFPVLGAEGEMVMQRCIGICHGSFLSNQSSLRDERIILTTIPGLERPG